MGTGEGKGGGSTGGGHISLPTGRAQIMHIFRKSPGHLEDTPENRALLVNTANNPENYAGKDKNHSNLWYSKCLTNGKEVWVQVKYGIIQDGGLNETKAAWDPKKGLINPNKPGGKK